MPERRLSVKLPNGCYLEPGGRVRVPREHIWHPDVLAASEKYGWELEEGSQSPSSEVIRWEDG